MRAILYLAAQGTTCSSKDIAQDMSIPRDYLIQLAQLLRNAGLIEARPGKHGGYRLAKEPSDITVLQIMKALEEDAKASTRAAKSAAVRVCAQPASVRSTAATYRAPSARSMNRFKVPPGNSLSQSAASMTNWLTPFSPTRPMTALLTPWSI